jgi:Na+-translocating ferredoxin:NAD+ oxidoreductase RnfG subunit
MKAAGRWMILLLALLLPACQRKAPVYVDAAFPGALAFQSVPGNYPEGVKELWQAEAQDGSILGYCVLAEATGFNGSLQVVTAWIPGQGISHVQIIAHSETPEYGGNHLNSPWFTEQFFGNPQGQEYNLVKLRRVEATDVVIITGATASSQAVILAVNQCVAVFRDLPTEEDGK